MTMSDKKRGRVAPVYLYQSHYEIAQKIGQGNVSKGVRLALNAFDELMEKSDKPIHDDFVADTDTDTETENEPVNDGIDYGGNWDWPGE